MLLPCLNSIFPNVKGETFIFFSTLISSRMRALHPARNRYAKHHFVVFEPAAAPSFARRKRRRSRLQNDPEIDALKPLPPLAEKAREDGVAAARLRRSQMPAHCPNHPAAPPGQTTADPPVWTRGAR